MTSERFVLGIAQFGNAVTGQLQQSGQVVVAEGGFFAGALHFDESAAAGHHDVHVDLGVDVFDVIEIEHRPAVDDAHADRRHAVAQAAYARPGRGS